MMKDGKLLTLDLVNQCVSFSTCMACRQANRLYENVLAAAGILACEGVKVSFPELPEIIRMLSFLPLLFVQTKNS